MQMNQNLGCEDIDPIRPTPASHFLYYENIDNACLSIYITCLFLSNGKCGRALTCIYSCKLVTLQHESDLGGKSDTTAGRKHVQLEWLAN